MSMMTAGCICIFPVFVSGFLVCLYFKIYLVICMSVLCTLFQMMNKRCTIIYVCLSQRVSEVEYVIKIMLKAFSCLISDDN